MEKTPFYTPTGGVITTRQVMHENWPVLLVTHDADDGGWQFVNGWGDTDGSQSGMVVHVEHVLDLDPSLSALSDLPLGWRAWRESIAHDWKREPIPE